MKKFSFLILFLLMSSHSFGLTINGNPGGSTRIFRAPTLASDYDFDMSATPIENILDPGSTVPSTVEDSNYLTYTNALVETVAKVDLLLMFDADRPVLSSSNESIATITQGGSVSWISNGTVDIYAHHPWLTKKVSVPVSRVGNTSTTSFVNFVSGSLGKFTADFTDNGISGKTPTNALPIFSTRNDATSTYVRNTGGWFSAMDMTCLIAWNSFSGPVRGGTAITPRHVLLVRHFDYPDGTVLRFVTSDNQVVTRTMTSHQVVMNGADATDLFIGKLDTDLPASIKPAKIMSATAWDTYAPGRGNGVMLIGTNQDKYAFVLRTRPIDYTFTGIIGGWMPEASPRYDFSFDIRSGDSGHPLFLNVNNSPVILTVWTWGGCNGPDTGCGAGLDVTYFKDQINTALTSLGGGYQLTEVDLSGFNAY